MEKDKLEDVEIPEDLGIEIGNPDQVFWESVKDKCEGAITNAKRDVEINFALIGLAEKRIKEEKAKFKKINEEINK